MRSSFDRESDFIEAMRETYVMCSDLKTKERLVEISDMMCQLEGNTALLKEYWPEHKMLMARILNPTLTALNIESLNAEDLAQ